MKTKVNGKHYNPNKELRPRVIPLKDDAACIICGVKKPLERSHIIPRQLFFTSPSINKNRFIDYDGINTLVMCRNHHRLYETGELDEEDFRIIWIEVVIVWLALLHYYTELASKGVKIPEEHALKLTNFLLKFKRYEQTRGH